MGTKISNQGPDLHAFAEPSFFKPYIIVNDKGCLESTHVIRWCYEKICGALGGIDRCDSNHVGRSPLHEVQVLSKTKTFTSQDVEDIKKISLRTGLTDSPKLTPKNLHAIERCVIALAIKMIVDANIERIPIEEKWTTYSKVWDVKGKETLKKYLDLVKRLLKEQAQDPSESPTLTERSVVPLGPDQVRPSNQRSISDEVNVAESEESETEPNFQHKILVAIAEVVDEVKEEAKLKRLENEEGITDEENGVNFSESEEYQHYEFEESIEDCLELINPDDEVNEEEKMLSGGISKRVCHKALDNLLADQYKATDPETRDDGDCFYDAFAKGLSKITGKTLTVQDLRDRLKVEVDRLHDEDPNNNWVKIACENDVKKGGIDDYEKYRSLVGTSYQTVVNEAAHSQRISGEEVENTVFPPWGRPDIDGVLLCRIYNVKLEIVSVEVATTLENAQLLDTDPDKYFVNQEVYPKGDIRNVPVIEIAAYPSHFTAVKDL